jgi:predicted RNase H-like HicB family nuclease
MSDGDTIDETITNGSDAMRGWIEAMRALVSDVCPSRPPDT